MTIIICTTTFLDGRDRFEAGERLSTEPGQGCRVITDDQAAKFTAAGWVHEDGAPQTGLDSPSETTLDIHSVIEGHKSEVPHG